MPPAAPTHPTPCRGGSTVAGGQSARASVSPQDRNLWRLERVVTKVTAGNMSNCRFCRGGTPGRRLRRRRCLSRRSAAREAPGCTRRPPDSSRLCPYGLHRGIGEIDELGNRRSAVADQSGDLFDRDSRIRAGAHRDRSSRLDPAGAPSWTSPRRTDCRRYGAGGSRSRRHREEPA